MRGIMRASRVDTVVVSARMRGGLIRTGEFYQPYFTTDWLKYPIFKKIFFSKYAF